MIINSQLNVFMSFVYRKTLRSLHKFRFVSELLTTCIYHWFETVLRRLVSVTFPLFCIGLWGGFLSHCYFIPIKIDPSFSTSSFTKKNKYTIFKIKKLLF